ncbi:MAG: nickel-dependent hydrogenase large subunit [Nitrospirota bacterium]
MASVRSLENALGIIGDPGTHDANGDVPFNPYYIPANGRIIQNIIHGADTVMSHITHLYHLSALDYINTSTFPGMGPWLPSYTASDMIDGSSTLGTALVTHYVEALAMRRKMHTAGALFSGRQPIQNALVPGGVTTLFSSTVPLAPSSTQDYDLFGPFNASDTTTKFTALLNEVRAWINTTYIPDVVTVANAFSGFWSEGAGCLRLLAYGDFPVDSSGTMLLKRGYCNTLAPQAFDAADIVEYVDYSWYQYGLGESGLHPFSGRTEPTKANTQSYSWLKAPRLMPAGSPLVCEVGPLARMVNTHIRGNQVTVTDGDLPAAQQLVGGAYNASQLITTALGMVSQPATALYSALGRHAARALEAKYIADAMAIWVGQLTADAACYTYKRIPKQISTGAGLCEAPRGALGHWIKIEGRKVAKYQCVVPTTWNGSPKDVNGQHGPIEQSLMNSNIGTNPTDQIVRLLRLIHPFDICIACAVHVVTPEGKEKMRFAIDPDGRPKQIEISA